MYTYHVAGTLFRERAVRPMSVNQLALTIIGRAKATMYLPKIVAASHFSLIVVIRSLTHLLTCRALTVAVMYVL
jgi:hypothetical protein